MFLVLKCFHLSFLRFNTFLFECPFGSSKYMFPGICLASFSLIDHRVVAWQALAALGLKTGGTVQQRAERLFLTKVIVNQIFCLAKDIRCNFVEKSFKM